MKILKFLYELYSKFTMDPFEELKKVAIGASIILLLASIITWILSHWKLMLWIIIAIAIILIILLILNWRENNRSEYERWQRRQKKN